MPPRTLFRLGLSLLFLALTVYFSTGHWLNSRIFEPLDYPVTLDTRHLQSPPFRINLNEAYYASLDLDDSADDWYQDNRCNYKAILYGEWWLYKLGSHAGQRRELWVSSGEDATQHHYFNGFRASSGQYQLEWDLRAAASCLNGRHPRLHVITDSGGYRQAVGLAQLCCIFLGGTGLALVVIATARLSFPRGSAPSMFPDMVLRNFMPLTKHEPLPVIHALPHWGILCATFLWILIIIFLMFGPQTPHGLLVSVRSPEVVPSKESTGQETIGVYVAPHGRFFVNGEEVERGSLRTKLLEHLVRGVAWTVYFEGHADTLYMDDVYAIDTIEGCGAKLIWITPKMREEWRHKEQSAQRIPRVLILPSR
jgi:biopolymer transport protein ExbD